MKKSKISYELEIVFLQHVLSELYKIKLENEGHRQKFSNNVCALFNMNWGNDKENIKQGAAVGVLKGGEAVMNNITVKISDIHLLVRDRIRELQSCLDNKREREEKI